MPSSSKDIQEILNGRYKLDRLLGEGGMGSVYLARDVFEEDKVYALKILKTDLEGEAEAFRREFELLAELRHPYIARVFEFGTIVDSGLNYYTTELIEGDDFYSAVRDQNWELLIDLVVQVCSALDYLHGRGILHRDLKPENILVGKDTLGKFQAKLCDFGLALRGEANDNGFCGSVEYAAPELLKGEPATQKTDLYALGVTLYQAVTGELPFPAQNFAESIKTRLEIRPTRPSKKNQSLPEPLEEVILNLLEPRPEERPSGAREVVERLAKGLNMPLTVDSQESLKATIHCGRYIERSGELESLNKIAGKFLSKGGTSIIVIQGAFGSGKTRLLEEWRTFCELEGLLFYYARAREGEAMFILRSWLRQLLGEPTEARKDKEKAELLDKYSASLSMVLPSFFESGKKNASPRLSEQGRRLKIFEDLHQTFTELLAKQPVILAADDLHEADQLTLEALRYILQAKKKPRAIWALAFGDSATESAGFSPDQLRLTTSKEIQLGNFESEHVNQYLEHVFAGQKAPGDFCDYLIENTGGIPLYIEETLLELLTRGEIRYQFGAWNFPSKITGLGVARGFNDFLERRVKRVTGEERELLQFTSMAENDLPVDLIASLIGKPKSRVQTILREQAREGMVLLDDTEEQLCVRLAHRTLVEKLREEISAAERKRLNLKIADALIKSDRQDIWAGEIARQLYAGGETDRVPDWAIRAADRARASFQNEQALELYRLAITAMEATKGSAVAQAPIRLAISQLESLAGRIPESIEILKDFLRQHESELDAEQTTALMERLAIAYERKAEFAEALQCWDAAAQNKSGGERSRMMANVGWIRFRQGDVKSSLDLCKKTLVELEEIGDIYGQGIIYHMLGRMYFYSGDLNAALKYWSHCLKLREMNRDKKDLADCHNNLGIVFASQGEVKNAGKHFEMALQFSKEVGDFLRMNGLLVNLGIMAFEAGDLDLAQRRYSEALEFFLRSGSDREILDCLNNLGEISLLRAEYDKAIEYWEECLKICAASGYVQGTVEPLTYLGTLHIASNCISVGQEYLENARKAAEGTQAQKEQALILEQRGVIALQKREFEEARSHFKQALDALDEMNRTFLSTRLKLRMAELAWYEGRKSEYSSILEKVEKELKKQESRWLRAELNRLKGFDLRTDKTEEALDAAIQLAQPFPDLLWRAYWLQGRYYHHRRRYGSAGQSYQKAIDTVKKMFSRMPDTLKNGYSKHPDLLLLKDNATKLKTEIVSARRQSNV